MESLPPLAPPALAPAAEIDQYSDNVGDYRTSSLIVAGLSSTEGTGAVTAEGATAGVMALEVRGSWQLMHDPASETYYYLNTETNESVWDPPEPFAQLDAVVSQSSPIVRTSVPLEAAHSPLHDETQASTPHNDSISTTTGGTRRGNWEEVLDNDSGGVYYYNHLTGDSQWDAPVEFRKGHFFASAAHKLLAVSALAAIAVKVAQPTTVTTASNGELVMQTAEDLVGVLSAEGAAALYAVGHWTVFADPDTACPFYFDNTNGSSVWEEPPEITSFKESHPELFVDGFDEHVLCVSAFTATEAEFGATEEDPTANADFIGSVGVWHIFNDAESGCCYYFNTEDQSTQWEAPPEVAMIWDSGGDGWHMDNMMTHSASNSLIGKGALPALGGEKKSALPPIRLGHLPVANKGLDGSPAKTHDLGAGLGKLLDGDSKRRKKPGKSKGKPKPPPKPASMAPVVNPSQAAPVSPIALAKPALNAKTLLDGRLDTLLTGVPNPTPVIVTPVVSPETLPAVKERRKSRVALVPSSARSTSDDEGSMEFTPAVAHHSPIFCQPLLTPPPAVHTSFAFNGPSLGSSSPPKLGSLQLPGRSVLTHQTTGLGTHISDKSYNLMTKDVATLSPPKPMGGVGVRVLEAPKPLEASLVRRTKEPLHPRPPSRAGLSVTLGVEGVVGGEPSPLLSSQFVRKQLMQASAMQSIAAAQSTLYPTMPDVGPKNRRRSLEPLGPLGKASVPLPSSADLMTSHLAPVGSLPHLVGKPGLGPVTGIGSKPLLHAL